MKVPEKGLYKTALGSLKAALKIVSNPKHWTQDSLAINCDRDSLCDDNSSIDDPEIKAQVRTPDAVAFCAMGAVMFVNGPGERKAKNLLVRVAQQMIREAVKENQAWGEDIADNRGTEAVFAINDYEDKRLARKKVLEMFRRAIELAK